MFLTFSFPQKHGCKSNMATIFAVELCHEGSVGVSDQKDAWVKCLDFLFAALVGFNADISPTPPVIFLPFESW